MENDRLFYRPEYGEIVVPAVPLKDREFGGHLIVNPSGQFRCVSDMLAEKQAWLGYHLLCSIAEKAMLEALPCLNGEATHGAKGIINLFEAGNWGVHTFRAPIGPKDASSKIVHAHIYGRSVLEPCSTLSDRMLHWGWGEAPRFPDFRESPFSSESMEHGWPSPEPFNAHERALLRDRILQWFHCFEGSLAHP